MSLSLSVGDQVPVRVREPSAKDLFMFSSAAWLLHRIHYDTPFTIENEGHPALLIHGPLQGVYMLQAAESWIGSAGRIESVTYRHRTPAYLGDVLECGGSVVAADEEGFELELWVRRADGTVTTNGSARFST